MGKEHAESDENRQSIHDTVIVKIVKAIELRFSYMTDLYKTRKIRKIGERYKLERFLLNHNFKQKKVYIFNKKKI